MIAVRVAEVFMIGSLVLMLPSTLQLFRIETDPPLVAIDLISIAVFIALYVTVCLRWTWTSRSTGITVAVWAALTLIASYLGFKPFARMEASHIYAAVVAGAVLGPRLAVPLTMVNAVLASVAALAAGVSLTTGLVVWAEVALFAVLAMLLNYLWTTVFELRAAREEIARLAVHEERLRFSRDLHDLVGRSLSLIALKSELSNRLLSSEPQRAAEEMHDVERVARDALREVREAVTGYRQPTLASELAGARAALAAAGVECCVEQNAGAVPTDLESVLAWTVREGVTNVIRHSHAKRCDIRITRAGGRISVEIVDDGHGVRGGVEGSGLRGLSERASARGGTAEAGPLPKAGFSLRVTVPVRA